MNGERKSREIAVKVSKTALEYFWTRAAEAKNEFWAFDYAPKVEFGDWLVFELEGKQIAKAQVCRVEGQGVSTCGFTCRFKNSWKVFCMAKSFEKIENGQN